MQIRDAHGVELPISDGAVALEEDATYRLECPGAEEAWFGGRPLERGANGQFLVPVGGWAGSLALRVRRPGAVDERIRVEVVPRSSKLEPEAWARLLEDLDAWLPGITVGREGGQHGVAGAGSNFVAGLAVGLIEIVPAICSAVRAIAAAPRERLHSVRYNLRLHMLRRLDVSTVRSLVSNPAAVAELNGEVPPVEPAVPAYLTEPTIDHPVNRYVVWLLGRVDTTLERLIDWLEQSPVGNADTAAWSANRVVAAKNARLELVRVRRTSFLSRLRPEPPGAAALVTAQNDPAYARLQRLCRPFLSPSFRPPEGKEAHTVPVRPSYGLYELWAFLAVHRLLEEALPEMKMRFRGLRRLFAGNGTGTVAYAKGSEGTLAISFNPIFPGYLVRKSARRFSLSGERRPDLVVTWAPSRGEPRWICLDAKYRVGAYPLADSFESAHIYRDSLIMTGFGGKCAGAWLLVPAMQPQTESWFSPAFSEQYGTGAFVLRPGANPSDALKATLLAVLRIGSLARSERVAAADASGAVAALVDA